MKSKITIELTEEQIDKIMESRQVKKKLPLHYSIAKAARLIGISESTIHRRIKDGFIKKEIIGKSPRITQEEIDRFLNKL